MVTEAGRKTTKMTTINLGGGSSSARSSKLDTSLKLSARGKTDLQGGPLSAHNTSTKTDTGSSAKVSARNKSDLWKKLAAGRMLYSEINKAASKANLLQQRRYEVFVTHLESAKNR